MPKLIKYILIILVFNFIWLMEAHAKTTNASSCSRSDVQLEINSASDGDIVVVPAGTCEWTSKVQINNKGITLQGAGIDQTIIVDNGSGYSFPDSAIAVNSTEGKPFRVTGFTFQSGASASHDKGLIYIYGSSKNWRVDHNKFNQLKTRGIYTDGHTYGVIDNNVVDMRLGVQFAQIQHSSWDNIGSYGDNSWANPSYLGTEKFVFFEDNTFTCICSGSECANCKSIVDCQGGGRYVLRYNTATNTHAHAHGTESGGRSRSCRVWEIYNNTFTESYSKFRMAQLRGGTGVIHNNVVNGSYDGFVQLASYRSTKSYSPWGICNGTGTFDGNSGSPIGYPCIDQPGRGKGILLSNYNPTPAQWAGNEVDPVYEWNNTLNGTNADLDSGTSHVQKNRDYFNCTDLADCQSKGLSYTPYQHPHPLTFVPENLRLEE